MIRALGALALPLLRKLEPETAHRAALAALGLAGAVAPPCDPRLRVAAFGLDFVNPLGLAAGFDKNAQAAPGLLGAGFGFIEVGTLTPRPQSGNPKPRLFRLPQDGALVNRLGFNNDGYEAAHRRLERRRPSGIVGVNIGPNRDAVDRVADYVLGVRTFADVASYLTINVSSPNTPGLRDLQQRDAFDGLVARVIDARESCPIRRPILVKIAPDVDLIALDDIVSICRARGVDGMIVGNTTTSRPPSLRDPAARETGGLSGRPLFDLATRTLARAFLRVEGAFGLVGCGGVDGADAALAKIEAGATLIQLYTALTYRGPGLVPAILFGLVSAVTERRVGRLRDLVGAKARDWAAVRA